MVVQDAGTWTNLFFSYHPYLSSTGFQDTCKQPRLSQWWYPNVYNWTSFSEI